MNKSPAFQWYPRDILSSARVQELTLEEEGAYRRLLDFCWLNGSIPSDPERCARLIGKGATAAIANEVQKLFIAHPDDPAKLIHDRLELERERQEENRNKKKAAADARWSGKEPKNTTKSVQAQSKSNAPAMQMECPSSATSSATSLEIQTSSDADASLSENQSKSNPQPESKKQPNVIWDLGVAMLVAGGDKESSARSFLGKLARDQGQQKLAAAIAQTSAANSVNPKEYLVGILKNGANHYASNGTANKTYGTTSQSSKSNPSDFEFKASGGSI